MEKISEIARTEGFLRSYQTQRLTKDGQLIDVLFTRTAIKDNHGNLIGFSSVLKNVTEQKLIDRHLAQMEKLSALGEMAAGLAHEIKNPLAGIKGAIEIIRDGMPEDDPHRMILAGILLKLHSSTEIPPITADENDLRQLFMNLIINSIEAMETHGQVCINLKVNADSKLTGGSLGQWSGDPPG